MQTSTENHRVYEYGPVFTRCKLDWKRLSTKMMEQKEIQKLKSILIKHYFPIVQMQLTQYVLLK